LKKDTVFFRQAELLLRVLPFANEEEIFALKGGTAINFFLRGLPRFSVDIDLTYLPVNDRETALNDIDKALLRIFACWPWPSSKFLIMAISTPKSPF